MHVFSIGPPGRKGAPSVACNSANWNFTAALRRPKVPRINTGGSYAGWLV
ncbi:MAG: hypothetical protein JWN93_1781 [Hyphomicrobiales bacterium]|nr:hypothetical protein [Hyphomicrobiales bacterium]